MEIVRGGPKFYTDTHTHTHTHTDTDTHTHTHTHTSKITHSQTHTQVYRDMHKKERICSTEEFLELHVKVEAVVRNYFSGDQGRT